MAKDPDLSLHLTNPESCLLFALEAIFLCFTYPVRGHFSSQSDPNHTVLPVLPVLPSLLMKTQIKAMA
jgi:hypothetical protein